ncbi:AHH domain-containing protein [Pyxidicoccus sp. 3LG]
MSKAASKPKKKTEQQPLGTGESEIFNDDLSVKPGNFPELDDANYPAKLKQELQKEQAEKDRQKDDCPPALASRRRIRGFHKYRTAAYIHDQGGRGHFNVKPDYGEEKLEAALGSGIINDKSYNTLSDDSKWKSAMAFPREDSPKPYSKEAQRFLLTNMNYKQSPAQKTDEDWVTGPWVPYQWTAHHLIPHELLTEKELGAAEYQLLMESGYDVNNGHNGIIAPMCDWAVPMHCVLQHLGNHPNYTGKVIGMLAGVKRSLGKLAAQVKQKKMDHSHAHAALLDQLTKIENELWSYLLDLSRQVVPEALQGNQLSHPHVAFVRNKGQSLYRFGVLT